MTPNPVSDLLAELTRLGIELSADGDRLRYRPREAVTVDLAERMKIHKAELLAVLATRRRIAEQLAQLVPYRTPDGRRIWVNPRYRAELDRLGL